MERDSENATGERRAPAYDVREFFARRADYCLCVFVLNEGERIARQLDKMRPLADVVDIIIADGGSSDGAVSEDACRQAAVRTLLIKRGPGKLGAQMRMAFDYALAQGYRGVITVDGNDKDDVAEGVPRFLAQLALGVDHVQGSRFVPSGRHAHTPLSRLLGVRLLHAPLLSLASGFRHTDTTNGFRAYSRRLLESDQIAIFRDVFVGYELHYHLSLEAPRAGMRMAEVPVTRVYPAHGKIPTKIDTLRGKWDVFRRLLEVIGGCYRQGDELAGAALPERLLIVLGRVLRQTFCRLHARGRARARLLRTLPAAALLIVLVAALVSLSLGDPRVPEPLVTMRGYDARCAAAARSQQTPDHCVPTRPEAAVIADPRLGGLSALTLTLWVRPRGFGPEHMLVYGVDAAGEPLLVASSRAPSAGNRGLNLRTPHVDGTWGREQLADAPVFAPGRYHHVAISVSWDAGTLASYVDGQPVTFGSVERGLVRGRALHRLALGHRLRNGSADDDDLPELDIGAIALYDRALDARAVRRLVDDATAPLLTPPWLALIAALSALGVLVLWMIGCCDRTVARCASLVAMTLILQLSFGEDRLRIAPHGWFSAFQRDSESLVFSGLLDRSPAGYAGLPDGYGLGFSAIDGADNYYALPLTRTSARQQTFVPYRSQIGIQPTLLAPLRGWGTLANRWDVGFLQTYAALATSLVAALLVFSLGRTVSAAFGAAVFVALLASQWLTVFARNLYWLPALWLLPSVCVLLVLGRGPWRPGKLALAGMLVAATIGLKSLAGYEYLSTILLTACTMTFVLQEPTGIPRVAELMRRAALFVYLGACGTLGFVAALLWHARIRGQGAIGAGLVDVFENDVKRRTAGADPAAFSPAYEASFRASVTDVGALYLDGYYIAGLRIDLTVLWFACLALGWLTGRTAIRTAAPERLDRAADRLHQNLLLFTLGSFAASFSWFVLAKAHSFIHTHLNFVMWTLFFVPALSGWTAHFVVSGYTRRRKTTAQG